MTLRLSCKKHEGAAEVDGNYDQSKQTKWLIVDVLIITAAFSNTRYLVIILINIIELVALKHFHNWQGTSTSFQFHQCYARLSRRCAAISCSYQEQIRMCGKGQKTCHHHK